MHVALFSIAHSKSKPGVCCDYLKPAWLATAHSGCESELVKIMFVIALWRAIASIITQHLALAGNDFSIRCLGEDFDGII
jgi:hypothetical protein